MELTRKVLKEHWILEAEVQQLHSRFDENIEIGDVDQNRKYHLILLTKTSRHWHLIWIGYVSDGVHHGDEDFEDQRLYFLFLFLQELF